MNDIERSLVAGYLSRVLARPDLPLRALRHLTHWLNERSEVLSLPVPKPLAKVIGHIYGGNFSIAEFERAYRAHEAQLLQDLQTAAQATPPPEPLTGNVQMLVRELGLPPVSADIVGLIAHYGRFDHVEYLCDCVGEVVTPFSRTIAALTGQPARIVEPVIGPNGDLVVSGLLKLDEEGDEVSGFNGRFQIPPRVNNCLDREFARFAEMRKAFLGTPLKSAITAGDYDHVEADRDLIAGVLRGAATEGASGVNILLYGQPGSGKTELCKVAAESADLTLYSAGEDAATQAEQDRGARLADLVFSLRLLAGSKNAAILFDEMEDVASQLIGRGGSKLYLNRVLERSPVPVLWTSNNIHEIDPAVLRRMTLAIELRLPPARQRERILRRLSDRHGVKLSENELEGLARKIDATPAIMENALKAARYAGQGAGAVERAASGVVRAVSGAGARGVSADPDFDPKLASADCDLVAFSEQVAASQRRNFSICLSGPPGTGKSAYARYLASRLGIDILQKRASDLLGAFVGESEKRIAEAFEEARDGGAMLVFDEAESFLLDRRDAVRSWEVTQVNEMLTWMEQHPLPVCFTTNLFERFDTASLRRFTFHITLTYLDKAALAHAFRVFFGWSEPPEGGLAFDNLTPGDFAQVYSRADMLGATGDKAQVVEMLGAVSRTKPGAGAGLGFVR
ncbi:MAG: AAA family ATPase [Dichotomicrobium sp.]